jgi:serine protease Do
MVLTNSRALSVPTKKISTAFIRATMLVLLPAVMVASIFAANTVNAKSAPQSFAPLVERLLPTVVYISSTQNVKRDPKAEQFDDLFKDFLERYNKGAPEKKDRRKKATSLGSGFIIDPSGYIVTNNHVIEGADEVSVRLYDGQEYDAEIIGRDSRTDLALLKVNTNGVALQATEWGDSDVARVGDWIVAIGNPFGLGNTVTAGIISARGRDINSGPYDSYIQTDASINRGNSGGPSFDIDGKVIGVNTAIFSPSGGSVGIGFAIPSKLASRVISQLKDHGEVKRGWLGVRIQQVTEELALGLKLDEPRGALVSSTTNGGPAEKAGILKGDVILEFNGSAVAEMRRLPLMVAETEVGSLVDVVVWRKGEAVTVQVTLDELTDAAVSVANKEEETPDENNKFLEGLGIRVEEMTTETRSELGLDNPEAGVQVTGVANESVFYEKGIRSGDVIVEVDQQSVATSEEVSALFKQAQSEGFGVSTILVFRSGDYRWIAVRLPKE